MEQYHDCMLHSADVTFTVTGNNSNNTKGSLTVLVAIQGLHQHGSNLKPSTNKLMFNLGTAMMIKTPQ